MRAGYFNNSPAYVIATAKCKKEWRRGGKINEMYTNTDIRLFNNSNSLLVYAFCEKQKNCAFFSFPWARNVSFRP